jgi:peptidoglycan hydrolase CwlO-like protein
MLSISRILTLLAGALISAVVLKRKENSNADATPWRTDLDELQAKFLQHLNSRNTELAARLAEFQPKIEALAAELTVRPDGRIDDLAAQLAGLHSKIEALAARLAPIPDPRVDVLAARLAVVESKANFTQGKVDDLQERVSGHDQKLQATNQMVVEMEQMLTGRMADFDERVEAQGRTLQAMNSSIAQSDELLERVLDMVQNLLPAAELREPVSITAGGEIRELQL